jgi:hypothetical protein
METVDKIKVFLIHWYGPDNPQQKWFIVMTIFVLMLLPRGSRRLGAILACVLAACWFIAHFVMLAFWEYTPH